MRTDSLIQLFEKRLAGAEAQHEQHQRLKNNTETRVLDAKVQVWEQAVEMVKEYCLAQYEVGDASPGNDEVSATGAFVTSPTLTPERLEFNRLRAAVNHLSTALNGLYAAATEAGWEDAYGKDMAGVAEDLNRAGRLLEGKP